LRGEEARCWEENGSVLEDAYLLRGKSLKPGASLLLLRSASWV